MLLIAGGLLAGLLGLGWLGVSLASGGLQIGGAILGAMGLLVLVAPLLGGGIFLLIRSRQESRQDQEQAQLRKILDVVAARGKTPLSELVIELGSTRQAVKDQIYALVGMGVFSGYINWDEGILYSAEASNISGLERCKYCGGQVDFVGKGVLTCPYCGTEYFIS
jgi:hypothetical protein